MAKRPTITNISSGYASTTTLNDNFEQLRDAFDNTLSLDGSTPNAMQADLDLNGYSIANAGGIIIGGQNVIALLNTSVSSVATSAAQALNSSNAAANSASAAAASAVSAAADAASAATSWGYISPYTTEIQIIADDLIDGSFVAGDIYDFGSITTPTTGTSGSPDGFIVTVHNNLADITTVAGIDADVTTVAGLSADVSSVAAIDTDVAALGPIAADVTTAAGNTANITTVAGNITNINTVAGDTADINALGPISADITTAVGISANITSVAGISADVTAVAADATDIGVVATDLAGSDTIGTVAADISDVSTVATDIANVNTVATNMADVNSFGETYRIGATDPTTSLDIGDLFFNTTSGVLKVYDGVGWTAGVTAGSGFLPLTGGTLSGLLGVTTLDFGDWTLTESGGSLYFETGGSNKMKLDASGNLEVVGNITANATIV